MNLEYFSLLDVHLKEENKNKLREFVGEIVNMINEDLIDNWQENPNVETKY